MADRWPEIKDILLDALDEDPGARSRLLDRRCGDDAELRAEVERYLAREPEAERLIPAPAFTLMAPPPPEGREGTDLGSFRLGQEIGRGGMGVVYRAERRAPFAQDVAVKVLKRGLDTEEIVRRFERERRILSRLQHPAIVRILDGGSTEDGLPYLVMERVDGVPIDRYCHEHGLGLDDRLRLFVEVVEAVHHAHQNLIVHRDLKPANLLVDRTGRPRLLDFGIAKLLDEEDSGTRTMAVPMTPIWASPEQRLGAAVTTASDTYSLGKLLERLVVEPIPSLHADRADQVSPIERPPQEGSPQAPRGASPSGMLPSKRVASASRASDDPEQRRILRNRSRRLRGDLDLIVHRARHVDPDRRYSSAAALGRDVTRFLEGRPVSARPDALGYRLRLWARRHPLATAAAIVGVIGIVIFAITVTVLLARVTEQRDRALQVRTIALKAMDATDPNHPDRSDEAQLDKIKELMPQVQELPVEDRAALGNRLGQSLLRLDASEKGVEMLTVAVAAYGEHDESLPRDEADARNNLGKALIDLKQTSKGVSLVESALALLDSHHDPEVYPKTRLEYVTNLAYGLEPSDLGRAADLYQEVYDERCRRFAPDDLAVGDAANNLGTAFFRQGRFAEALPLFDEAIHIRHRRLGAHEKVAKSLANRSVVRLETGDAAGAVEDARESLTLYRSSFDDNPRRVLASRLRLADALLSLGTPLGRAEAMVHLEAVRAAELPTAYRIVADRHVAHALAREGEHGRAAGLARDALDRQRADAAESWRVADLENVLGGALIPSDPAAARTLLESSWQTLCAHPKARPSALRQAADRLEWLQPPIVNDPLRCRSGATIGG